MNVWVYECTVSSYDAEIPSRVYKWCGWTSWLVELCGVGDWRRCDVAGSWGCEGDKVVTVTSPVKCREWQSSKSLLLLETSIGVEESMNFAIEVRNRANQLRGVGAQSVRWDSGVSWDCEVEPPRNLRVAEECHDWQCSTTCHVKESLDTSIKDSQDSVCGKKKVFRRRFWWKESMGLSTAAAMINPQSFQQAPLHTYTKASR